MVHLVIELVDARIPISSRNPDIDKLGQNKARLILMNKTDLADPRVSKEWKKYFTDQGYYVVLVDARKRSYVKDLQKIISEVCQEKIERDRRRGIMNRPVRAMVVGIPNVGKSTLINTFAGKAATKTGNKPGVTKGKQWIRLNKQVELLDTPGILWPKFEDQSVGMKLALIGSIKDELVVTEELCLDLIKILQDHYRGVLNERYGCDEIQKASDVLIEIAKLRNCVMRGNELDYSKAANLVLDEFRVGKLGQITLERPTEV